jgi:hypothetical protein
MGASTRERLNCLACYSPGLGSDHLTSQPGKTNPIEAIDIKSLFFSEMTQFLMKRSHSSYLACFHSLRAKSGPVFGKCGSSRTRIRSEGRLAARRAPQTGQGPRAQAEDQALERDSWPKGVASRRRFRTKLGCTMELGGWTLRVLYEAHCSAQFSDG